MRLFIDYIFKNMGGHLRKKQNRFTVGQSAIEFILAMAVTVLLIIGMVKVFSWTGRDLAERRKAHEQKLKGGGESIGAISTQLDPNFFSAADIGAGVRSDVFGKQ